ncbi:uncharacterized protein BKA78DRAFT_300787 [Phyllosticta capitalensis]|uniref:uncharacterized protein n=1 Tax=Phyllosticta capitalensis TaxID=121624 RepID=UPI00313211B6
MLTLAILFDHILQTARFACLMRRRAVGEASRGSKSAATDSFGMLSGILRPHPGPASESGTPARQDGVCGRLTDGYRYASDTRSQGRDESRRRMRPAYDIFESRDSSEDDPTKREVLVNGARLRRVVMALGRINASSMSAVCSGSKCRRKRDLLDHFQSDTKCPSCWECSEPGQDSLFAINLVSIEHEQTETDRRRRAYTTGVASHGCGRSHTSHANFLHPALICPGGQ